MKQRPFVVTNPGNIFPEETFNGEPAIEDHTLITEAEATNEINNYLTAEVNEEYITAAEKNQYLALYNGQAPLPGSNVYLTDVMPVAASRASAIILMTLDEAGGHLLVDGITGTYRDSGGAAHALLYPSPKVNEMLGEDYILADDEVGEMTQTDDGTPVFVLRETLLQHPADIKVLAAVMIHELVIHDGKLASGSFIEEGIANFAEIFAWAKLLERDPLLAKAGSIQVQFDNLGLYILLNSLRSNDKTDVGLRTTVPGYNTVPGNAFGVTRDNYEHYIRTVYQDDDIDETSPGHLLLNRYFEEVLDLSVEDALSYGASLNEQGAINFDDGAYDAVHENVPISNEEAVKLARILGLEISDN